MLLNRIKNIAKVLLVKQDREVKENEISFLELKDRIKENKEIVIVDVRSPQEYQEYHLYNAINIPLYELENRAENELEKEKEIILYCQSGIRSKKAVKILEQKGYQKIYSLENGLNRKK